MIISQTNLKSPHSAIELMEITYCSQGLRVKAYLATPRNQNKLPGLLYLRGGIKRVGMVRIERVIQWASEGMVVMAPFYRGNFGGEGREDFCGEDRQDAISAFDVLESLDSVNRHSIHIVGFSRGGTMALLTGMERSNAKTITCWNGVSDMKLTYEERVDLRRMMKRVVGGTPNKYPERYEWRTPLGKLEQLQSRVLIIHGLLDEHVSVEHAFRLKKSCDRFKKQADMWLYPTFKHQFPYEAQKKVLASAAQWMRRAIID
ncbi:S9 family peptidase [Halalkalibacter sp. APA_J-10(15)]|uniref:alpha/beta hydrolase family protein n=1 Tax=Halalkalibacter sp. APA_J-10(15) TaxID=2933805 RepID=UPI001FF30416|nr:prolyl oligopeptidase family serine peptidase [Halalkalibacter sp. APA_J-10(15)]MCK0471247.1 prolyl oligopeptidase family serine peptidase [Halalkalibacter sp. APA_J-10(15)]